MEKSIQEVKLVAKTKGLWKLAFLTFLLRHRALKHIVHVHVTDGTKTRCVDPDNFGKTPSLSGQS